MARNRYLAGLVFLIFFVMSLLTNILGPLVPDIISSFGVTLAAAALLHFRFSSPTASCPYRPAF